MSVICQKNKYLKTNLFLQTFSVKMLAKLKQLNDFCKPEATERQNKYVIPPVVRFIPQVGMEAGEAEYMISLDLVLMAEDKLKTAVRF